MSRHVGLVRAEDVLEGGARLPYDRSHLEESLQERRGRGAEQLRERNALNEGPGIPSTEARPSASAEAPQQQPRAQAKSTPQPPVAALLLPEVAQLLREGPPGGDPRDCRSQVQQAECGRRRMRVPLLRPRLQRRPATANRKVRLQVPLVLLRSVSELHCRGVDHSLQVNRDIDFYPIGTPRLFFFTSSDFLDRRNI